MIRLPAYLLMVVCLLTAPAFADEGYDITFESLLNEMADRTAVAQWPEHEYKALLASSYNRATKTPDDPNGWFANGDTGYVIREETNNGRRELVMMEHDGPGVITRIWVPFFFGSFNDRTGETVRIYLDGNPEPVIETNLIGLIREEWKVKSPFSHITPRAGDLYLPIPYGKSCKITVENRAFFYNINYRAYLDKDVKVQTFSEDLIDKHTETLEQVGRELLKPTAPDGQSEQGLKESIAAGGQANVELPKGSNTIQQLTFKLDAEDLGQALRSTVVEIKFDGKTTVWCPLGDFFATVRTVEPYNTWERDVMKDGTMVCRWLMPYEKTATLTLHNLGEQQVKIEARVGSSPSKWTGRSMHFYAAWTTLGPLPPNPKKDMNFVEIKGKGIHVGDNIAVVNPNWAWWGEGDEKIYVDDDFERNFPSQIGTGTEDYYGWAGGRHPTREDEFHVPFLANVRVGGEPMPDQQEGTTIHTRGYNTCTRTRALDANLFRERFKFDMEHWNFSQGRTHWLHYAKAAFWYAAPGSTHNREPMPDAVAQALETPESIEAVVLARVEADLFRIEDAIDFETLKTRSVPDHTRAHVHTYTENSDGSRFNRDTLLFFQHAKHGDSFEFTITEQYKQRDITLYMVKSWDFGVLDIYVNGKKVKEGWDGYSAAVSASGAVELGKHKPDGNLIRIKFVVTGKHKDSKGTFLGMDCFVLE